MFVDSNGMLYEGDMRLGDRDATQVEIDAWNARVIVPPVVTMRQARRALLDAGLLASVTNAIAAMTGPAGDAARIDWEYSSAVERNASLVLSLAPALSLTDQQLDALFVAAAQIPA